jgi:hypothetical protein
VAVATWTPEAQVCLSGDLDAIYLIKGMSICIFFSLVCLAGTLVYLYREPLCSVMIDSLYIIIIVGR